MKKVLSVLMVLVITVLSCTVGINALAPDTQFSQYPIIMVPGYSSATLTLTNSDGSTKDVWGLNIDEVLEIVLKNIAKIGVGLGRVAVGDSQYIADVVGKELVNLLGSLTCNPDGSSKYDVKARFSTPEETNSANMFRTYGDKSYQFETDIMGEAAEYVGTKKIFNFNVDFRMGAVYCAECLDEYIDAVLEYTKAEKVNLLAVSHGGQVTATYLTLYGNKQKVNNAVMTVPAIGGAALVHDLFGDDPFLDELNLIKFIEHGMRWEDDFHWLVEAQELGFLDDIIIRLIPHAFKVAGFWGSLWDFVPSADYEAYKAKWLDKEANAKLIEKCDYFHYTVMPKFKTELQRCEDEYGINVSIIAGTDNSATSGWQENSDGIISTNASTGATVAPFGQRFADGYTQVNECGGKYKVSPAMTVDASTAYLPDDTWFVEGLFHGMTYWDYWTRDLMLTLALTDKIKDVYTDPAYPQFHASTNPSNAVWCAFDKSVEGYVSFEDTQLVIKNISWTDKNAIITGITCDGADLDFNIGLGKAIKAGESIKIPFSGTIPAVSCKKISITLSYTVPGAITPIGERVMSFTVMNGEKASYDSNTPYVSAHAVNALDKAAGDGLVSFLKNIGLYNFVSMFFTIFNNLINSIVKLFA